MSNPVDNDRKIVVKAMDSYRNQLNEWLNLMDDMPFSPNMRTQIRKCVVSPDFMNGERARVHDFQSFCGKEVHSRMFGFGSSGSKNATKKALEEEGILLDQSVNIASNTHFFILAI